MARTGPTEPVLQRPLVGEDRKSRFGVVRTVLDLERTCVNLQCVHSLLRCSVRPLEPACFWLDEWFRPGRAFLQTREFAYSAFRGAWHRSRDRRRRTCWHGRASQTPVLLPHLQPAQPGNRTEVRLCPGIDTPRSSDHRPWPSGPRSTRQAACALRE